MFRLGSLSVELQLNNNSNSTTVMKIDPDPRDLKGNGNHQHVGYSLFTQDNYICSVSGAEFLVDINDYITGPTKVGHIHKPLSGYFNNLLVIQLDILLATKPESEAEIVRLSKRKTLTVSDDFYTDACKFYSSLTLDDAQAYIGCTFSMLNRLYQACILSDDLFELKQQKQSNIPVNLAATHTINILENLNIYGNHRKHRSIEILKRRTQDAFGHFIDLGLS